uniref:glycosyltransferase family 4 protein n=1 Tax=Nakamurella sp. TaxID=1869182 RepID=UPI003B3A4C14
MDRVTGVLHAVVPAGIDDPARPSGGNRYDRRLLDELAGRGRRVHERHAAGAWPQPSPADRVALDRLLGEVPDGSPVLIDGLIACAAAPVVSAHTGRLRVVVLLHMPLGTAAERDLLPRCAAVVTSSRWVAGRLRDDGLVPGDRPGPAVPLVVAEPGVDPAAPISPSAGGGRLLAVAVLAPHKGQDVLIAALHRIADLPWTCTVAGSPAIDPGFAGRLRTAAAGLGDRVRFVGPLTGPELDRAYAAADLLVHPSRSETYGMVLTEALARAIPVVATDVGGIPDAVGWDASGRRPGRLVAPDDDR